MKVLYILYQLFIALPILLVLTILTAIVTIIGSWIGNPHFWGYYPGKIWSGKRQLYSVCRTDLSGKGTPGFAGGVSKAPVAGTIGVGRSDPGNRIWKRNDPKD